MPFAGLLTDVRGETETQTMHPTEKSESLTEALGPDAFTGGHQAP